MNATSALRRRFESLVSEAPLASWLKLECGRFLALSPTFAAELGACGDDAPAVCDRDFFSPAETRRFREGDRQVIDSGSPKVFVEPPDAVTDGWYATLKIPLGEASGSGAATLCFSRSIDALQPLLELIESNGHGTAAPPASATGHEAKARLEDDFLEELRVTDLARALGRHPDHVARCFRRTFGSTIAQYVRARRVAWACSRLIDDRSPISQIALQAGFYDQSHFTRAFREVLGTTPGRYRRAARRAGGGRFELERAALELAAAAADAVEGGGGAAAPSAV